MSNTWETLGYDYLFRVTFYIDIKNIESEDLECL
jgi:hypothetical protein